MHKKITPPKFPKARGYTDGILCGPGRTLHISGQIGWDERQRIVSDDMAFQFLAALDNVIEVVREAGGGSDHIVKLLAFVTDMEQYRMAQAAIGEGWRTRFGKQYPAMSLVRVSGLIEAGAKVEIEGIAVIPE